MGLGVIRMEPAKRLPDGHLVDHVRGLTRPSTHHVHAHLGVGVEVLRDDPAAFDAACRRTAELAAAQRGGRAPSLSVSWLFAIGGVDTSDVEADASTIPPDAPATLAEGRLWTLDDCRDYLGECDALLAQVLLPGSYVLALHLDEKAVHVHAEGPAIVRGPDGTERIGNNAMREKLASLAPGFAEANAKAHTKLREREANATAEDERVRAAGERPAKRRRWIDKGPNHVYLTAAAQMRLVHDLYAERFARFGVERGKGGRKRHHEQVDRSKAMDAKLKAVEREKQALREQVTEIEREKQALREQVTEIEREKQALREQVTEIEREKQALREQVTEIEQHHADAERKTDRQMELLDLTREKRLEEEAPDNARVAQRLQRIVHLEQDQSKRERERDAAVGERDEARRQTAAEREAAAAAVRERDAAVKVRDQTLREVREAEGLLAELRGRIDRTRALLKSLTRAVDAVLHRAWREAAELAATIQEHLTAVAEAAEQRRQAAAAAAKSWTVADQAKEEEVTATEKAAAAVREWDATRERIATDQRAAEQTLEETRAAVADDRAVGRSPLSRRGREIKRELARERELRETAEQDRDAEREVRVEAEARTAAETERADAETKRADEAEDRVKVLEGALWAKQTVDDITAEPGRVSEVDRVRELRAQGAKASAPKNRPAPAPARAPTQPGRGIGG